MSLSSDSLIAQSVKNLPAMQETWVGKIPWRRKWPPAPVFSPGESHGQRSLAGYSPWGRKSWTWLNDWPPPPKDRTQSYCISFASHFICHRLLSPGINGIYHIMPFGLLAFLSNVIDNKLWSIPLDHVIFLVLHMARSLSLFKSQPKYYLFSKMSPTILPKLCFPLLQWLFTITALSFFSFNLIFIF